MSAEDKRRTVLGLFHDSGEPWLLKDMEKAASKKGVVFQAVKDVVQALVDDSLVHVDKIGTSNWYWAFKGEVGQQLQHKLGATEQELARAEAESAELDARLGAAAAEHPVSEERQVAEVLLASAAQANAALRAEVQSFASGDSAMMDTMQEGVPLAKDGANRWTDNVFMLKSWVEKKLGGRDETNKFFKANAEIDFNNFDYME